MFNEMEKTVKKLLTIIKKNYNGYPNEKLIIKFLSNIIYLIKDTELSDEKKIREIKYNINNNQVLLDSLCILFPGKIKSIIAV